MKPIQAEINRWSRETFGDKQTVEGIMIHLDEELDELDMNVSHREEFSSLDCVGEEIADCIICLLDLANRLGIDAEREVLKKHAINMGREWNEPDEFGVIYHKKEGIDVNAFNDEQKGEKENE